MYNHPNKTQEKFSADALSVSFFFQSQIADRRGFSLGARNRRRATGTWPSQTWHPPGKVAWPSVPSSTDSSPSWCGYQSRPAALRLISVHSLSILVLLRTAPYLKPVSRGCVTHSCYDSRTCIHVHFRLLLTTCKTLESFRNAGSCECISDLALAHYVNGVWNSRSFCGL